MAKDKKEKKKGGLFRGLLPVVAILMLLVMFSGDEDPEETGDNTGAGITQQDSYEAEGEGDFVVEVGERQYGTGLVQGEATSQLDENPDRAVRRNTQPVVQTVGAMLDGTPLTDEFYFYRNTLTSKQQKVYDQLRSGLMEGAANITLTVAASAGEIADIYFMVTYDNPEMFWVETTMSYTYNNYGNVTSVTPTYNDLVYDIEGNKAFFEEAVAEALADMWSLGSEIERVKYAHDYLTSTITYQLNSPYNQSAYSALVRNVTVCAGYSRAFQYMMQKVGIPCAYVVGIAGERHAWNLLELEGDYYMMDVTWDDPLGNPSDVFYYDYFNITDSQIENNHSRLSPSTNLPAANGTKYSFQNLGAYGTDFDGIQGEMPVVGDNGGDTGNSGSDNPYLPTGDNNSGNGGNIGNGNGNTNPYLPSDSDNYIVGGNEDVDWSEVDWGNWSFDDYAELGYDWWNALDADWEKDDWTDYGGGMWEIWDEETHCYYFYTEDDGTFGCMDANDETFYLLNYSTGEWLPLN
ncbi:MAG: hypothetical protein IJN16_09510 [Lachnospiraceae bacterium]|nr:hypothetical protein [Lachnospiraceae bacterium]